ncbi:hypothetical protein AaE_015486, partial [Aphanomyces astaci]
APRVRRQQAGTCPVLPAPQEGDLPPSFHAHQAPRVRRQQAGTCPVLPAPQEGDLPPSFHAHQAPPVRRQQAGTCPVLPAPQEGDLPPSFHAHQAPPVRRQQAGTCPVLPAPQEGDLPPSFHAHQAPPVRRQQAGTCPVLPAPQEGDLPPSFHAHQAPPVRRQQAGTCPVLPAPQEGDLPPSFHAHQAPPVRRQQAGTCPVLPAPQEGDLPPSFHAHQAPPVRRQQAGTCPVLPAPQEGDLPPSFHAHQAPPVRRQQAGTCPVLPGSNSTPYEEVVLIRSFKKLREGYRIRKVLLAILAVLQRLQHGPLWDVVHLDEKWFNADKDRRTVYLLPDEAPQRRSWKSKRFIPKVMFLAAVARPRFDEGRGVLFDGKVGMWPFTSLVPAVRSSRNRPAGTLVTTLVNVNAQVYRDYVINKVVPAIKASFPSTNKRVILQQDNATPHRSITDAELVSVSTDGWTFVVRRQPPNSPDLNVLDLGFFASIQSLQLKKVSRTVDEVIQYTLAAFDELSYEKLESVFLTFQAVMRLVLEHAGDNNFALPHLKKAALRRAGLLMSNVSCPVSLLL